MSAKDNSGIGGIGGSRGTSEEERRDGKYTRVLQRPNFEKKKFSLSVLHLWQR